MLKQFLDHIERENLCNSDAGILLAVSGGMDSMVMLDLFAQTHYRIAVAHFNHVTRAGASDEDEAFVSAFCHKKKIPFFSKRMDVKKEYPSDNFQDRARILRYEFLNRICDEHGYSLMATAHHLDDQLESFLINYSRGAGLAGLSGIHLKINQLIRPMLFCGSKEIQAYQLESQVPYVEDASNASDAYLRNRVRHHVVPELKKAFPALLNHVERNQQNLSGSHQLLNHFVAQWQAQYVVKTDAELHISKKAISALPDGLTLCHYLLAPYGFNRDQMSQLLRSIDEVGLNFYSATHRILVDRADLILTKVTVQGAIDLKVDLGKTVVGQVQLELAGAQEKHFETSPFVEMVDMDTLVFPLQLRGWQPGDRFMPLGMSGRYQKVKDLLINTKVPQHKKEKVLVLLSEGQIVWVIGHRLDQRNSISQGTKRYLKLSCHSI